MTSVAPVREGDVLAGKYRVERVLGVGGMGVVVAAHHLQLDERVALKFLLPEVVSNAEVVTRFLREARAAVKIKSEHVARVTDVGTLESGSPYIVMEYLEGSDLSTWLEQRGALPVDQAVELILQACEAVAEAHSLGIVHRDLKPANLFCIRRPDGELAIKVLDFGISKTNSLSSSGGDASVTRTQAMLGSPLYMSPEQLYSSRDVDARTDIWAIGVILFELLAGRPPFEGDGLPQLVLNISNGEAPPLRAFRPDVPEELAAVVARCLEKKRDERYSSLAELAPRLAQFAPKRSRRSVERVSQVLAGAAMPARSTELPPSTDPPPRGAATVAEWGTTRRGEPSRGVFVGAAVVAAVLLLCLGGYVATRVLAAPAAVVATAALAPPAISLPQPSQATAPSAAAAAVAPPVPPTPAPSASAASAATVPAAPASPAPQGAAPAKRPPAAKPAAPPTPAAPAPAPAKYDPTEHL